MNTMITFIGLFLAVTDSSQTSNCTDDPVAAIKEMDGGGLYFRELFHDDKKSDDDIYDGGNGHGHMEYVGSTLRSLRVHVRIVDGISKVTMVQEFQTPRCVPASFNASGSSALYRMPMDELAAVTEFRAEVENRTIQAVVKERREAQDEFDAAVANGTTAYLAEQSRADVFHLSVGNLPVNTIVRVTLVYVSPLETVGGDVVRFVLPTAVAPRYEPYENSEEFLGGGISLINDGVQIELDVAMAASIDTISSPTHDLQVDAVPNSTKLATVHVTDENPTERDVVILLQTMTEYQPMIYVDSSSKYNATAIMLSIVPDISDNVIGIGSKQEYIFVVDRSGSMGGTKMEQTRSAMAYIIQRLPTKDDCRFNIVGFGSEFRWLFEEGSRPISDDAVRDAALDYVESMDADYGGTRILAPLRSVLGRPRPQNYERLVFVLTDGAVSNTDDTIEYVRSRSHVGAGRVFALGIGEHVSALLVRGIARAGRGTAEFVDGGVGAEEAVESAVERQMQVALTPSLLNLTIAWGGGDGRRQQQQRHHQQQRQQLQGQQAPFVVPPILTGKRFLVYYLIPGHYHPQDSVPDVVRLYSGTDLHYEVNSSSFWTMSHGADLIHKIACRSLIRDLEEGGSELHAAGASAEEIRAEIVRLGVKYQLASSETSFVAVDSKEWIEANSPSDDNNDNMPDGGTDNDEYILYGDTDDSYDTDESQETDTTCKSLFGSLRGLLNFAREVVAAIFNHMKFRFFS